MSARPWLRRLADRVGIQPDWVDVRGVRHEITDETRVLLLDALGYPAPDEDAAAGQLHALERRKARRLVRRTRVLRRDSARAARVRLHPPEGATTWRVELHEEDGRVTTREGGVPGGKRTHDVALPRAPGLGYHRVVAQAGDRTAEQALIVVPVRCHAARDVLGERRVFGLHANLYALRDERDRGIGDLTTLATLVAWTKRLGGAYVGVNPLHALRNRWEHVSPYNPVSRLFVNPLYADVGAEPAPTGDRVAYAAVAERTERALRERHRAFADDDGAYARYREERGPLLDRFAAFLALEARHGCPWKAWPEELRDPGSPAVARFAAEHAGEVDLHRWAQFETERQLAAATRGLPLGLMTDLALGSAPDGFDTWAYPDVFLDTVRLGAPPDDFNPNGQEWGLPALHPRRLHASGYGYWVELLRAAFRDAGALRIDHVLGLLRQWWIPRGRPASEGAYVRVPTASLLGILALESRRHRTVVVGEDLGTTPLGLQRELARRSILSTRVLTFARTPGGGFRGAGTYPTRALAMATTHDLPPLAGWAAGRDLQLWRETGVIDDDERLADAHARRARELAALRKRIPDANGTRDGDADWRGAIHRFVASTPCRLAGLWIEDLAGETEPVNLPGVPQATWPSWTRRLSRTLESLDGDPEVTRALGGVPETRGWNAAAHE